MKKKNQWHNRHQGFRICEPFGNYVRRKYDSRLFMTGERTTPVFVSLIHRILCFFFKTGRKKDVNNSKKKMCNEAQEAGWKVKKKTSRLSGLFFSRKIIVSFLTTQKMLDACRFSFTALFHPAIWLKFCSPSGVFFYVILFFLLFLCFPCFALLFVFRSWMFLAF